jgi:hypothetical protein
MRREGAGSVMSHRAGTACYYWTTFLDLIATAFNRGLAIATAFNRGLAYEGKGAGMTEPSQITTRRSA